jgi:RND family efflux transporter MFP subunit
MTASRYSRLRLGVLVTVCVVGLAVVIQFARPAAPDRPRAVAIPANSALTVDAVRPEQETWRDSVQASGPIAAWQEIIVSPEVGGLRIAELLVDVGDTVARGQLLARLADDSLRAELRKQEAAVSQATANFERAQSNAKRAQGVAAAGAMSEQQIEDYRINMSMAQAARESASAELDATNLKISQTRVIAVDDGVVTAKTAILGNVVNSGAELFRIVRQGRVEWQAELDSRQLAQVQAGQTATVTLPNGEKVQGMVRTITPALNTATGRAIVYVSLPIESSARTGMFASGSIDVKVTPALTLPQSAIVARDGRSYVYVIGEDDVVSPRSVTTGRRLGDRLEVLTGLEPDARVVASGGAFLSDGARVTVGTDAARAGGSSNSEGAR